MTITSRSRFTCRNSCFACAPSCVGASGIRLHRPRRPGQPAVRRQRSGLPRVPRPLVERLDSGAHRERGDDPQGAGGAARGDRLARGSARARLGLRRVSFHAHRGQLHPEIAQAVRAAIRRSRATSSRCGAWDTASCWRASHERACASARAASALALWQANRVAQSDKRAAGQPAARARAHQDRG